MSLAAKSSEPTWQALLIKRNVRRAPMVVGPSLVDTYTVSPRRRSWLRAVQEGDELGRGEADAGGSHLPAEFWKHYDAGQLGKP
jgi:hypothetical protein